MRGRGGVRRVDFALRHLQPQWRARNNPSGPVFFDPQRYPHCISAAVQSGFFLAGTPTQTRHPTPHDHETIFTSIFIENTVLDPPLVGTVAHRKAKTHLSPLTHLVDRATPISTAEHDEARKIFAGRAADRQRAVRAALLSSAQREL